MSAEDGHAGALALVERGLRAVPTLTEADISRFRALLARLMDLDGERHALLDHVLLLVAEVAPGLEDLVAETLDAVFGEVLGPDRPGVQ